MDDRTHSPALFTLSKFLQFYNYLEAMVPAALRRVVAEKLPHANFQRLRSIVMMMHQRSVEIFHQKRAALERGDEAMKQQLGEGKDIMSILCASCSYDFYRTHSRPAG